MRPTIGCSSAILTSCEIPNERWHPHVPPQDLPVFHCLSILRFAVFFKAKCAGGYELNAITILPRCLRTWRRGTYPWPKRSLSVMLKHSLTLIGGNHIMLAVNLPYPTLPTSLAAIPLRRLKVRLSDEANF
ncbi:protein of unknown function [Candidatus Methylomirabilis oxygeniifera]|uniref:Uncharacterized protein n=1 Tax=Methylomirabilis oxygeniifera TaxID=671143 RepID=D5MIT8_METO1|nr:protein of unknown function [Candidatus Methylomirabilis oxyfera]